MYFLGPFTLTQYFTLFHSLTYSSSLPSDGLDFFLPVSVDTNLSTYALNSISSYVLDGITVANTISPTSSCLSLMGITMSLLSPLLTFRPICRKTCWENSIFALCQSLILEFHFFFCNVGDWTKDSMHARQVLYQLCPQGFLGVLSLSLSLQASYTPSTETNLVKNSSSFLTYWLNPT